MAHRDLFVEQNGFRGGHDQGAPLANAIDWATGGLTATTFTVHDQDSYFGEGRPRNLARELATGSRGNTHLFVGSTKDLEPAFRGSRVSGYTPIVDHTVTLPDGRSWDVHHKGTVGPIGGEQVPRNFSDYVHTKITVAANAAGERRAIVSTANIGNSGYNEQTNLYIQSSNKQFVNEAASVVGFLNGTSGIRPAKDMKYFQFFSRDAQGNLDGQAGRRVSKFISESKGDITVGAANLSGTWVPDALLAAAKAGRSVTIVLNGRTEHGEDGDRGMDEAQKLARNSKNIHIRTFNEDSFFHANAIVAGDDVMLASARPKDDFYAGQVTDVAVFLKDAKAIGAHFKDIMMKRSRPGVKQFDDNGPRRWESPFSQSLDLFMPKWGQGKTRYSVDPEVLTGARNYNLERGRGTQNIEQGPGLGEALYEQLRHYETGSRRYARDGKGFQAVQAFDRAMGAPTLGQSNWWAFSALASGAAVSAVTGYKRFGVAAALVVGGAQLLGDALSGGDTRYRLQLGNRGPLDSLVMRVARDLDSNLSINYMTPGQMDGTKEGALEKAAAGVMDFTTNTLGNLAGYYYMSLPFMVAQVEARKAVEHGLRIWSKKELGAQKQFGESGLKFLSWVDEYLGDFTGRMIENNFKPVLAMFGPTYGKLGDDLADLFLGRTKGRKSRGDGSYWGKSYQAHFLIDKAHQRTILRPVSSEGLGRFFAHYGIEWGIQNTKFAGRLLGDLAADVGNLRKISAAQALAGVTDTDEQIRLIRAGNLQSVLPHRMNRGAFNRLAALHESGTDRSARIGRMAGSIADTGAWARTRETYEAWTSYNRGHFMNFMGFNRNDKFLLRHTAGGFTKLAIGGIAGGLLLNRWAGDVSAASRSTVMQQNAFEDAINAVNEDRVPLSVQRRPGMPTWDREWGAGPLGWVGAGAGLMAGAAWYTAIEKPYAWLQNSFNRFNDSRKLGNVLQTEIMGKSAWAQAVSLLAGGRADDMGRLLPEDAKFYTHKDRARLLEMARAAKQDGNSLRANELLIDAQMMSVGQRSFTGTPAQAHAFQFTPIPMAMTLTAAFSTMNKLTTMSLTVQAPVLLMAGATLTLPVGVRFKKQSDGTTGNFFTPDSWEYVPNSSLENLSYLASYGAAARGYVGAAGAIDRAVFGAGKGFSSNAGLQLAGAATRWGFGLLMLPLTAPARFGTALHGWATIDRPADRALKALGFEEADRRAIIDEKMAGARQAKLKTMVATRSGASTEAKALWATREAEVSRIAGILGRQTYYHSAWEHARNPDFADRAHVKAFHGKTRLLRGAGAVGTAVAMGMLAVDAGLSFWGTAYREEDTAAGIYHKLAGAARNVPIIGGWVANYFNVKYRTHPSMNAMEADLGEHFGRVRGSFNDHGANIWGFMARGWDRVTRAVNSAFYGGVPGGFVGTGFFGMVSDNIDENTFTLTNSYSQPAIGPFNYSFAYGLKGVKRNIGLDTYLDALNAQAAEAGDPSKPRRSLRMAGRTSHAGSLFHSQSAAFGLGASGRMEMRRRLELTAWVTQANVASDIAKYFFQDRSRRGGTALSNKFLPNYNHRGFFGKTDGVIGHVDFERIRGLFSAARQNANMTGGLAELEWEGPDSYARADIAMGQPKGRNAFIAHEEIFQEQDKLYWGIAAQLGGLGSAAGIGWLAYNAARPIKGERNIIKAAIGKGYDILTTNSEKSLRMSAWGIDVTRDEAMVVSKQQAWTGKVAQHPGHRYWLFSLGERLYTYGDVALHGKDPFGGMYGKAGQTAAKLFGTGIDVNHARHRTFFESVTNLARPTDLTELFKKNVFGGISRVEQMLDGEKMLSGTLQMMEQDADRAVTATRTALTTARATAGTPADTIRFLESRLAAHTQLLHGIGRVSDELAHVRPGQYMDDAREAIRMVKAEKARLLDESKKPGGIRSLKQLKQGLLDFMDTQTVNGERLSEVLTKVENPTQAVAKSLVDNAEETAREFGYRNASDHMGTVTRAGGSGSLIIHANNSLKGLWHSLGRSLTPGSTMFDDFETYRAAENNRYYSRLFSEGMATSTNGASTHMQKHVAEQADLLFQSMAGNSTRAEVKAALETLKSTYADNVTDEMIETVLRQVEYNQASKTGFHAGLVAKYAGARSLQLAGATLVPAVMGVTVAMDLSYVASSYAQTLYGLGVASDSRVNSLDRLRAAKAGLQDVDYVVKGSASLVGAAVLQAGVAFTQGAWKAGHAALEAGEAWLKPAMAAGGKQVAKLGAKRMIGGAIGTAVGAALTLGGFEAVGLGIASAAAVALGLPAVAGGALVAGIGLAATHLLFEFTPAGKMLDKWVDDRLAGRADETVGYLKETPFVAGALWHTSRVIGGVQSALDLGFEAAARTGTKPDANWAEKYLLALPAGILSGFFRLLDPHSASYNSYDPEGQPGASLSLDAARWRLPENVGSGSGLAHMTPLFYGSMRDQVNMLINRQEGIRKGDASAVGYSMFHESAFGRTSPEAASVMTSPTSARGSMMSHFNSMQRFGPASQVILAVRGEATQHQLGRLLERPDAWGERKTKSAERSSGYAEGYGARTGAALTMRVAYPYDHLNTPSTQDRYDATHSDHDALNGTGYSGDDTSGGVSPVRITRGKLTDYISSGFGHRHSPGGKGSTDHAGIDISGYAGSTTQAVLGGKVVFAGAMGGYGNTVVIDHGNGLFSLTGHQQWKGLQMAEGQVVKAGQAMGLVGSTGTSTGAHAHFEFRRGKSWAEAVPFNPLPLLKKIDADNRHAAYQGSRPNADGATGALVTRSVLRQLSAVDEAVQLAARASGMHPVLIRSMITIESGGNTESTSHAGALGLMQVMPGHWTGGWDKSDIAANREWTRQNRGVWADPKVNIQKGTAIFQGLLKRNGGDIAKAVSAYNGGDPAKTPNTPWWQSKLDAAGGDVEAAFKVVRRELGSNAPYEESTRHVLKFLKAKAELQANSQAGSPTEEALKLKREKAKPPAGAAAGAAEKKPPKVGTRQITVARAEDKRNIDNYAKANRPGKTGVELAYDPQAGKVLARATYPNGAPWQGLYDNAPKQGPEATRLDNHRWG